MSPKLLPYTCEEFVQRALSFVGVKESPPGSNHTPFSRSYKKAGHGGNEDDAWCDKFVWGVHDSLGVDLLKDYGFTNLQYTPSTVNDLRRLDWQEIKDFRQIRRGDWVFYDFEGDKIHRTQHTGPAALGAPKRGRVQVVEGNTSSGERGSQSDGDGVYVRSRRLTDISAVFRPPFALKPAPAAPPARVPAKARTTTVAAVLVAAGLLVGTKLYVPAEGPKSYQPTKPTGPVLTRTLELTLPRMQGKDVARLRGSLLHDSHDVYDLELGRAVYAWKLRHHISPATPAFGCPEARLAGWVCG